jgi:hypothetical protein
LRLGRTLLDPLNSALQAIVSGIQSLSLLLVLSGMMTAFLWKISAIINAIIGLLVTIALSYLAYTMTQNILTTILIFAFGIGLTFVLVAISAALTILEGFGLSALGFWGFIAAGDSTNLTGGLITAIILSIITTAISAFIGARLFSLSTVRSIGKLFKNPLHRKNSPPIPTPYIQTPNNYPYPTLNNSCRRCGAQNRPLAKFCKNCGKKL